LNVLVLLRPDRVAPTVVDQDNVQVLLLVVVGVLLMLLGVLLMMMKKKMMLKIKRILLLLLLLLLRPDRVAPTVVDQDNVQVLRLVVVVVAEGKLLLLKIPSGVLIGDAHGLVLFQSIDNLQHLLLTKSIVDMLGRM
jgi:hypothetical protein